MAAFTVCIPAYNSAATIRSTINSLLGQTFTDWDCIVVDNASIDATESIVRSFADGRISYIRNEVNLGCPGNFQRCRDLARGTYVYFLASDDILSPLALERTYAAFQAAADIGIVTRPYYMFENDNPELVVRYIKPLDATADRIVSADSDEASLRAVLETLGQVTGLAYRNDALITPFSPYVFTTHIEPFLHTLKTHRLVFLRDYVVAVRLAFSQTRNDPAVYAYSPLWTWIKMIDSVFDGPRWERQRRISRDNISNRVEGLIQVRCSSSMKAYLQEALHYLRYRPLNLVSPRYWSFALGCLIMPPRSLRAFVNRFTPLYTRAPQADISLASPSVSVP